MKLFFCDNQPANLVFLKLAKHKKKCVSLDMPSASPATNKLLSMFYLQEPQYTKHVVCHPPQIYGDSAIIFFSKELQLDC